MKGYIIEGQEDRAPITPLSDTWAGYGRSIKLKPRLRAGTNPSKLSPLQLGRLMRRFKIRFTGKTSRWPSEYENCFKQIEAIGQVKFETYPTYLSKYVGCASADELRLRTIELVRKAGIDDQNNVNEDTLRHHVKPIVFKQLESALECQVCQKLWSTAEFASSTSSTAARSSHAAGVRLKHDFCLCSVDSLSFMDSHNDGATAVFSDCSDKCVVPDDDVRQERYGIPRLKPDRVFGLSWS